MNNLLFIFGDSWPAGAELNAGKKTFGQLLFEYNQNKYSSWKNFSVPSSSIPHLVIQLRRAIDWVNSLDSLRDSKVTAVFFLSSPQRDMYFTSESRTCDGKNNHLDGSSLYIANVNPNNPEDQEWYLKYHSHELDEHRTNITLLTLQTICNVHDIDAYFIWGWDTIKLWPEVNTSRFYPTTCQHLFDPDPDKTITDLTDSKNKYIWPNLGHPNQLGHELIAKELDKFIKSC